MSKLYLLIDCQNDFIDGILGSKQAQIATKNICEFLKNVNQDDYIIYTKDTHKENYLETQEGKKLPVPHCIKHSCGWQINDDIHKLIKDLPHDMVEKNTFGSVDLISWFLLNEKFYDEIIVMGFCTDICVVSNALLVKAVETEIPVKVIANCCAGTTVDRHLAALKVMESCQIEVIR